MSDKKLKKLAAEVRDVHTTLASILAELRTIREVVRSIDTSVAQTDGKYRVTWLCPHCDTQHEWYWEEEFEAHCADRTVMLCNVCGGKTWCIGDGKGHFTAEQTLASIALDANQL